MNPRAIVFALGLLFTSAVMADASYVGPACVSTVAADCTQTPNSAAGNEPTSATKGLTLANKCGVRVVVSAASAQTLSASGTLRFWYYSPLTQRWTLNQNVKFTVSETAGTRRDLTFEDIVPTVQYGSIYVEADTVLVSGGTTITVLIETISCRA